MRFFWNTEISWKGVLKSYFNRTSPQSRPDISLYPEIEQYQSKQTFLSNLTIRTKRSVSLFPPVRGSITIETAFALPLFLFFCIQLISLISLMGLHSTLEAALDQEVAKAALQAYVWDKTGMGGIFDSGNIVEDEFLKYKVIQKAGKEYLDRSMIEGGSNGIHILYTGNRENQDVVDVALVYQVRPLVDILGFSGFSMANRCCMKAWTGYRTDELSSSGTAAEELVYVTETGSVYHKSRNCTHLTLSVRPAERKSLGVLRNEDGGRYYPCEHCGDGAGANIFLTDQGNRYHTSLYCSGLKRTVYTIPISEAGGRGPCSRCAVTG